MLNTWAHYYLKFGFKNDVQEHLEFHFKIFSLASKFASINFAFNLSVNSFVKERYKNLLSKFITI
ncbi:MAG: hypothetical protein COC22_05230 [Flavobacteriaceae bacterium]|nr:MAG: hypothetical protein COC22_05230 [Flavobacteriaceae bacterium]